MSSSAATASAGTMIAGPSSAIDPNPSGLSIRDFLPDEDVSNLSTALLKSLEHQSAFVLQQREAFEAYNVAKAIRLSEETAAAESSKRRTAVIVGAEAPVVVGGSKSASASGASCTQSQALAIRKERGATPPPASSSSPPALTSDEAAARSLARTWQVDALQPALLENTSTSPPSSSPAKQKSSSASASASHHDRKTSASSSSASAAALARKPSSSQHLLSLSTTTTFPVSTSASSQFSSQHQSGIVPASDSPSQHSHHRTRANSQSQSLSNSIPASLSHPHRIDHRSLSKRDAELHPHAIFMPTVSYSTSSPTTSASASTSTYTTSTAASSAYTNTTRPPIHSSISDVTNTNTVKRRRTERQHSYHPSTLTSASASASASAAPTTAPPLKAPAASTSASASARDVRMGQIMNPAKSENDSVQASASTSTQRAPAPKLESRHQSRAGRSRSHEQQQQRASEKTASGASPDIFTATRRCARCGHAMKAPRSETSFEHDPFEYPFAGLLHVTCSACKTVHCRGCFTVARCAPVSSNSSSASSSASTSPNTSTSPMSASTAAPTLAVATTKSSHAPCTGGPGCAVMACCTAVRAVAVFEALANFDSRYLCDAMFFSSASSSTAGASAAGSSDKAHAGTPSKEQRQAYLAHLIAKPDKTMRRCEEVFVRTLRLVCGWLDVPSSSASSDSANGAPHPSIPNLLAYSLLPEVMHAFLANTNVRAWVAHSETYIALLDVLRRMFDCGAAQGGDAVRALLMQPLRCVERTPGLRGVVWGEGSVVWAVAEAGNAAAQDSSVARDTPGCAPTLCDVVRQLEAHRRPLMALAAKLHFSATLEKVNNMCDGISYLLLQQVVGSI